MSRNKYILLLFFGFLAVDIYAQTMNWAVKPTSARIENYGQLLKQRKEGKVGLLDYRGQEVVAAEYDSITPFSSGYALVINRAGHELKIEGLLAEGSNELTYVADDVYVTPYAWFSEGLMPVKGVSGFGYMDTQGNMRIPSVFEEAYPFSERWASVKMDGRAYYIDHDMDYLSVEAGYGDLVFASTFAGGEAVVYSHNMKGYVINTEGRKLRNYKVKPDHVEINTYDNSVGNKVQSFNKQSEKLPDDPTFEVYNENGLFGYRSGGKTILPAQFDKVSPVRGGYANVTLKGQTGILKTVNGNIDVEMETTVLEVPEGKTADGSLLLTLPDELKDDAVRLRMTDEQGREYAIRTASTENSQRRYSFTTPSLPSSPSQLITSKCTIEVWNNDLLLWKGEKDINFKITSTTSSVVPSPVPLRPASLSLTSIAKKKERANRFDVFFIKVSVQNSGEMAGRARLTLFVNGKAVDRKNVNVAAKRTETVEFSVPNVKKRFIAKVRATFDNGSKSQEATIEFEPFY